MVQLVHAGQFDLVPKISNLGTGFSQGMEMANQFQAGKQKRLEDTQEQSFLRADLSVKAIDELRKYETIEERRAAFVGMRDNFIGAGIDFDNLIKEDLDFTNKGLAMQRSTLVPMLRPNSGLTTEQRNYNSMVEGFTDEQKKRARLVQAGLRPRAGDSKEERAAKDQELAARLAAIAEENARSAAIGKVQGTAQAEADTAGIVAETNATLIASDAAAKQAAIDKQTRATQERKLPQVATIYNKLKDADLSKIYGKGESVYPELLRSQEGIDLIADRDKIVSMLQLGSRGELKGQGNITDGETEMLSRAATILGNPNISPERAKEALDEAVGVLYRSAGRGFTPAQGGGNSAIDIDSLIQQAEQL